MSKIGWKARFFADVSGEDDPSASALKPAVTWKRSWRRGSAAPPKSSSRGAPTEAAAKIKGLGLATKLIFLTVQSASAYVKKARSLGAAGYVLKAYTHEQLRAAVAKVLTGDT